MILSYKNYSIYFIKEGTGDAVILLHGFLANLTMWKELVPSIARSNKVVAIDLLGHGQTGCLGYIHTMEMMAGAVNFVLEHLKIEKAVFIGHSMGGYVALAFCELFPNKVEGLCLMNSTTLPDSEEKQMNRNRAITAIKKNKSVFISLSVANLFAEHNRKVIKSKIEEVTKEDLKTPLQGIIAALEGMKIRKNRQHILQDTRFKKFMIIGRKDPILEYDSLINQLQGTDAERVIFPDGHMSH